MSRKHRKKEDETQAFMTNSDIKGNYPHISRQEVVDYKAADSGSMKYNGTKVVEYTKTFCKSTINRFIFCVKLPVENTE